MQRFGSVIELRPDKVDEYRRLHAAVWPGVLERLRRSNVRNYSIYLRTLPDGRTLLFSYYEYAGADHARDMAELAADPETQRWWRATEPCQEPLPDRPAGAWWAPMDEVFHLD
ncbi:MAG: L-rhamnose mutarotase [Planctomycetota bacterium]|nr:MAG: L-rhamnose mutarotase [Planctomycetota bacterium]